MTEPKLRFKDSEKRKFPEWEEKKLGEIALCLDSQRVPVEKNRREEGEIPYYGANGVQGYVKNWLFDGEYVLLAEDGGHYNEYSSKPIAQFIQGKAWVNNHAHIIEADDKNNTKFLFYSLEHKDIRKYINGSTRGKLTQGDMWKILLYIPALPEQQKIADFLFAYDRQIDIQSQRVEAMRTRKKGLLQKIFSREIRFKDDQGKDYPAWKEIKLRSIVHRVTRKNRNLITKRPLTISAELGLIDQEEFFSKKIASDNLSNYYLLHKGEFAFNRSSATGYPFGAIKRLNRYESGAISTLYICFSVDNSDYSDWLQHFFESTYWHKEAYKVCCEGARNHGLLNISVDDFFSMKLYLPTLPEQQKIADFLTAIDTQIEVEEKRLETMKTIKKGLLQQMFI